MTVDRRVQDEESCVFKLSSNKLNTNKKGSRLNAGFLLKLKRARDGDRILRLPRNIGKRRLPDCPKSFSPTFPQVYR